MLEICAKTLFLFKTEFPIFTMKKELFFIKVFYGNEQLKTAPGTDFYGSIPGFVHLLGYGVAVLFHFKFNQIHQNAEQRDKCERLCGEKYYERSCQLEWNF